MMTKPFAVGCCRCFRVLGKNGELVGEPGGHMSLVGSEGWASFATKEEADAAAKIAGWSVVDDLGPNHRCPDCRLKLSEEQIENARRGCYIDLRENARRSQA